MTDTDIIGVGAVVIAVLVFAFIVWVIVDRDKWG